MPPAPRLPTPGLSCASDSAMISMGFLVKAWPFVPGCDAAGVVVEVGDKAGDKFKVGDEVCGCTRLGWPGHSPAQEFVSMQTTLSHRSIDV
jgi:NADPH:quinone reductase-like Zn-dependent oxidoreductase